MEEEALWLRYEVIAKKSLSVTGLLKAALLINVYQNSYDHDLRVKLDT